MKISNILPTAAATAALFAASTGFAADAPAGSEWREVTYSCETGEPLTVAYRETGVAVQVTAADRKTVKLITRPAKAGFRYGDSRHELRGEGEVVTWRIGSKTPVTCTSDDAAGTANLAAVATR